MGYGYEDDVKRDFLEAFPVDFLQDAIRLLVTGYSGMHRECNDNHAAPEAHDLYPHQRRAFLEGQFRQLVRTSYPEIKASVERNCKKTSNYTLLRSGNVQLTINAVPHPNMIVRPAAFRETYARESQLNLFDEEPSDKEPSDESLLYAIMLHGRDPLSPAQPGFAYIVFPDKDCKIWVAKINLFDMFPDLIKSLLSGEEEAVADDLDFRIRTDIEEEDDDEAEGEENQTG